MSFEPDETIFRFLFTSPAHFVGAADDADFAITVVFDSLDGRMSPTDQPGPHGRSRFMLSIRVAPPEKRVGAVLPLYQWVGEEASALLTAFFGKLVLNLGHVQAGQFLTVPRTWDRPCESHAKPPFNSEARKPDGPPINLAEAMPALRAYVHGSREDEQLLFVLRASEFYRMALENHDERPEMAFALLTSALESLVELRPYNENQLYDEKLIADLKVIESTCPDGPKLVRGLKARLFQVKRKVGTLVDDYVPDSFFTQRETPLDFGAVKDRAELVKRVKMAYDIRSRLLHTGNRQGIGHIAHAHQNAEFVLGKPVLSDNDLVKLISQSFNLTGLERVTATVLREAIRRHLVNRPAAPPVAAT